jgi:hypothetical protein
MKLALVSTLLVTLVLTPRIAAHGWVASITVAGTAYQGPPLGTSSDLASVIRQVNTNSPVTSVSDPNLACGPNAQLAQDNADANPGDSIAVDWVSTAGAWFHDVGPMLTYLANCGSAPCSEFDAANAMWFKIQQAGRDASGWAQAQLSVSQSFAVRCRVIMRFLAPRFRCLCDPQPALQSRAGELPATPRDYRVAEWRVSRWRRVLCKLQPASRRRIGYWGTNLE